MHSHDLQQKLFVALDTKDFKGMKRFIKLGADVNGLNTNGETPLAVACYDTCTQNLVNVVSYLIKKGADLNKFEGNGHTPLFNAVRAYRPKVVKELLEQGANPNINLFPHQEPKIISSALNLAYHRFLQAVIKEKKGFYDDFQVLQNEIFCLKSIIFLLTEAGARRHEREVVPEYS